MNAALDAPDRLAMVPAAVRWLAAIAFVLAVPMLVIIGNVLGVAGNRDFIVQGFDKYGVAETTGLSRPQLQQIAGVFVEYLRSPAASLDVTVDLNGARRPLFNARELAHMEDVQQIFLAIDKVRLGAGVILLAVPILGLLLQGSPFLARLGQLLTVGGILTVVLLLLAGLASLVDFTQAFIAFHELAFRNDLWMLDPRTDYLIMLFPEGFWYDATMRIAMFSALEAVALGALGLGLTFWGGRR
ncbi:MAG: TIGR01906 family membrane protein [Chloroflexi bacterium]|nr:TIGR01906 family membrane protein [Chloroflexota bacterium]